MRHRLLVLVAILISGAALSGSASGSQLVDRDATGIRLAVNAKGEALVTYKNASNLTRHVLVWGALNALQPNPTLHQYRFKLDYAGGWGKYHSEYWKTFRNDCAPYTGPALAWVVAACTAPDGSHWALQKWQVQLPDLGFLPWTRELRQWELHISHWTGAQAKLEVWTDWVYSGRFHNLFGRYTYNGHPVYGFGSTNYGAPTDGYGRLLYLDTHNSIYGPGWRRENSFVSHRASGVFCYGFYPHNSSVGGYSHPPRGGGVRPQGKGDMYRLTAPGPGVTPDVMWQASGLHNFTGDGADLAYEQAMHVQLDSILNGDKLCRQH